MAIVRPTNKLQFLDGHILDRHSVFSKGVIISRWETDADQDENDEHRDGQQVAPLGLALVLHRDLLCRVDLEFGVNSFLEEIKLPCYRCLKTRTLKLTLRNVWW